MNKTCFALPTTSPGHAVWVASPSCRGTFEIVLLCLGTTVICVWSSVHRDIPIKRLSGLHSFLQDTPLILLAVFAPEILFCYAFYQYVNARTLVKIASRLDTSNLKPSSNEQHHYLSKIQRLRNVFHLGKSPAPVIRRHDDIEQPHGDLEVKSHSRRNAFTLTHGFYAVMGGFVFNPLNNDGTAGTRRVKLTYKGVKFLMEHYPDLIPDLSLTSITDRSKSGGLGKAVLTIQVVWFCLNCASRLAEGLPLSLLEVSTLSHGFMTLLSYAAWWRKPLNVDEPTLIFPESTLSAQSDHCPEQRQAMSGSTLDTDPATSIPVGARVLKTMGKNKDFCTSADMRIRSIQDVLLLYFEGTDIGLALNFVLLVVITIVYGALHLLGSQAQFASAKERDLWRFAAVMIMSSGGINAPLEGLHQLCRLLKSSTWSPAKRVGRAINEFGARYLPYIGSALYLLPSSYLLLESIRQLWYLPPEAFVDVSWSYYIPHWL